MLILTPDQSQTKETTEQERIMRSQDIKGGENNCLTKDTSC